MTATSLVRRTLVLAGFAAVLLAVLPLAADSPPLPTEALVAPTTPAAGGCGESGDPWVAAVEESNQCEATPALAVGLPEPEFLAKPGYCRCGCGARCRTSADCGGAECTAFISCC